MPRGQSYGDLFSAEILSSWICLGLCHIGKSTSKFPSFPFTSLTLPDAAFCAFEISSEQDVVEHALLLQLVVSVAQPEVALVSGRIL